MTSGPVLFSRYAYPPNALGYCGPEDHRALLEYGAARVTDAGLVELAKGFEGAWPYLSLIAESNHIGDPLDPRVVEAYWVGNRLLKRVDGPALARFVIERFGRQAGRRREILAAPVAAGAVPHHSFHVFAVYPWLGLLRMGHTGEPLRVLDRCRIRWGRLGAFDGDRATVRSQALTWDGRALALGAPVTETVTLAAGGLGFVRDPRPGDWVSMHWDWVCDRLTDSQLGWLHRSTLRTLDAVNRSAHPGPAEVLA